MPFFFIPESVRIEIHVSVDQAVLDLLGKFVDIESDRLKMKTAAQALDTSTKALADVVNTTPQP